MKKILMKRIFAIFLVLMLACVLCGCTVPAVQVQNEDGTQTIYGVLIEQTVNTVYRLIWAGTLALAAWVLEKVGKNAKLKNLNLAIQLALEMTRQTAEELQQTIVDNLKATRPGGKLTPADVDDLGCRLLNTVKIKLDAASQELIKAAGIDLDALITGECEAWVARMHGYALSVPLAVSIPSDGEDPGSD